MTRAISSTYTNRLDTLKRRRNFLDKRINDYQGKDDSWDKAEASAINWAISVIEANYESAIEIIRTERTTLL